MRHPCRVRRGLSTVVTSAIMLTAVAIIGSAIVSWSNSNLKAFETSLANSTASYTNKINENLNIENIAYCSSSKQCYDGSTVTQGVNVTLTNIGTVSVTITKIQYNNTDYTSSVGHTITETKMPATIKPGQSVVLVTSPLWWTKGKTVSTIIITTARGSIFTTQAAAQ